MARDEAMDAAASAPDFSADDTASAFFAPVRRGDFRCLKAASSWLLKTAAEAKIPQETADELDFCAAELLANIVGYAFDDDAPHEVLIHMLRSPDSVSLTFEDDGRAFDPIAGDTYVAPETLDDAGHRGYGVHLVRRFADDMSYRREKGRNIVTVVKFRQGRVARE